MISSRNTVRFTKLFLIILLLFSMEAQSQIRAMYATVWSISTPEKIDQLLETAHKYNFNQIFFQSRYRGDALYVPNKTDSSYENHERLCYVVKDPSFDPLGYAIENAKKYHIEIHAWVTVFVITPHDLWKIQESHAYYQNPEWVTYNRQGQMMLNNVHEGAFFDPGVPASRQYFLNIASDITANYDIDGIQFDYIRYPDSSYGFNPIALNEYSKVKNISFPDWKRQQISSFINQLYLQLKNINSKIQISAAVIAKQDKALNKYSQDWTKWLADRIIDRVYLMAYNTSNKTFTQLIDNASKVKDRKKMVIVVRAWPPGKPYPVERINEKVKITRRYHFKNFGFYSYSGMVENNYLPYIKFR
ncbi:MAG: hypothetical protein DRI84_01135 [Bacteroidetes bacterium]|nr:MAG: hypothetical protein DRI84_01135 [Bacteroidota bacterium]